MSTKTKAILFFLSLFHISISGQNIPDKIFFSGNIITMNPENPFATGIALKADKIIKVGSDEEILNLGDNKTIKIDLNGITVLPGFVDSHNHLFNDVEQTDENILGSQQLMFENGITTFGNLFSNEEVIEHLKSMDTRGLIKIKSSVYLPAINNCGDLLDDWWMNYPQTSEPGEKLRIGGVKVFTDGGTCGKLPAISWTYKDRDSQGDLFFDQETLNALVQKVDNAGYQLAIHAQGDRAIRQTVQALSLVTNGTNDKRHRIEHNSFIPADIYSLYGTHGIVPVAWGYYFTCSIEGLANVYGMEKLLWLEDWNSIIEANPGIPIAWHSDAPILPLNPIINIYSTVTKEEVAADGSVCSPPNWLLEHAISVEEALKFVTINSAYALKRDKEVGSLEAGKYADLVLLSDDPIQMDPSDLRSIEILATMADGEFVYCSESVSSICNAVTTAIKMESFTDNLQLKIYPNPGHFEANIQFTLNSAGWINLDLIDSEGQVTTKTNAQSFFKSGSHSISLKEFKSKNRRPGIYFIRLWKEGHMIGLKKFVIL